MEDVTVETQDVTVEAPEVEAEETEVSSPEAEDQEEAVQETVEQKLERLERENAGRQKAIDRKTAAYSSLQKKYEAERQELQRLNELVNNQTKNEPKEEDFETHAEYIDAVVEYRAEQKVASKQRELLEQQHQMKYQELAQQRQALRQSQELEYLKENPLYKASLQEVNVYEQSLLPNMNPNTYEAILTQVHKGNVPQIIDYFGKNSGENLEELGRISQLPPWEASVEIYKIQERLKVPGKKEIKTVTPVKVERSIPSGKKPLHKRSGKEITDWVNS